MRDRPFEDAALEAALRGEALPELPAALSAERLWHAAVLRRGPRALPVAARLRVAPGAWPVLAVLGAPTPTGTQGG